MSLRLDPRDGAVVLVLPHRVPLGQAIAFAHDHSAWLASRLAALPHRIAFADGATVPVAGQPHLLRHDPQGRCGVWAADGLIHVSGRSEHFARRVADWLKTRARADITRQAPPLAAAVGGRIAQIRLRDTRSRWGSCNARGHLAFSWRLVLAPPEVLGYVVAHEVCHLVEMNHSPAFWRLVETLTPDSATARHWLKRHGADLHRYG